MMAVRSGAKHVYACDLSHVMVRMSHDILVANQIEDKISVIHSSSHQLRVPETLPERYVHTYTIIIISYSTIEYHLLLRKQLMQVYLGR